MWRDGERCERRQPTTHVALVNTQVPRVSSPSSFVHLVQRAAEAAPERLALSVADERATYRELWSRTAHHAEALRRRGVQPGDRVLVLVPLSADLYAAVLAVMALGAAAVLASPADGRRRFSQAVRAAQPAAAVGTRQTLWLRWLLPALWRVPIRHVLTPDSDKTSPGEPFEPVSVDPRSSALLTFTSGTTGLPKGADRTHGTLTAQHRALAAAHPAPPDAVALTCFPVAALHHLCCGHTAVLPAPDRREQPGYLLGLIRQHGASILTCPPPILQALADHVLALDAQKLPIRQVGVGGAPVPRQLLVALGAAFPDADVQILYGSTEAEPVASLSADDALAASPDAPLGYPAGQVSAAAEVVLIALHDAPIRLAPGQRLRDLAVAEGEWGEVVVAGPHVVERYVGAPEAEARHKIRDENGRVWHRMGDAARRDADGRLWLGGRLGRMLPGSPGPVAPFPLEIRLEQIGGIGRVALHAHRGRVLAWMDGAPGPDALANARALLADAGFPDARLVPKTRLPVDARHRWKVDYAALDQTAARLPARPFSHS